MLLLEACIADGMNSIHWVVMQEHL